MEDTVRTWSERNMETAVDYGHHLHSQLREALDAHLQGKCTAEVLHLGELIRMAKERMALVIKRDKERKGET